MFYAQAFQSSTSSNICTLMANGFECKHIPFYSNPALHMQGEAIGTQDLQDNAKWIRENRFVLSNVGNETLDCNPKITETLDFDIMLSSVNIAVVECLVNQSQSFFFAYCDHLDNLFQPAIAF